MTEPIWCEDCEYFSGADMGGEGLCDVYKRGTWYGNSYAMDCPYFKQEKMNDSDYNHSDYLH